jgi:hypothetical protein
MENESTIFRAKVEPVKEVPESPTEKSISNEPTITTHEHTEKPPSLEENFYTKLLELGEAANHFQMPELTKEINDFILSEIKRQDLEDTKEVYQEILDKYKDRTRLPEGTDVYSLTEQIAEHIRIDRKLIEAMIAKAELEKKPINELSSKQLKIRIENGTV